MTSRTAQRAWALVAGIATAAIAQAIVLPWAGSAVAGSLAAPPAGSASSPAVSPRPGDEMLVVDCLLPGQIRSLGQRTTYASPRRPVRVTARECQIRGGEYAAYDRANLQTSLAVWLPTAKAGDAEAATVVGEIFERGPGSKPDYAAAAEWYRRASEQGSTRAQINLGHLYEKGLGVAPDPVVALRWYRRAAGLESAIELDAPPPTPAGPSPELVQELESLRRQLVAGAEENARLGRLLEESRAAQTRAQDELERARAEQSARLAKLEASNVALEERKRAADEGSARIETLAAALSRREAEVERQRTDAERLRSELVRLQEQFGQQSTLLEEATKRAAASDAAASAATASAAATSAAAATAAAPALVVPSFAGPEIAIIDPQLLGTRGVTVVAASVGATSMRQIVGRVTAPAGLVSLAVNEQRIEPNEHGVFATQVGLAGPETAVSVVAIDRQGKRATLEFSLRAQTQPAASAAYTTASARDESLPAADFGRYHALVIGNDDYQHLPDLNTAVGDAQAVAAVLGERYGFRTQVLVNADRYAILSALNDLRERLTAEDNLVLYYAGHGTLDEVNARGHWLPVDAERESSANWIATTAVTDILNIMKARRVLVVADSCYAGALTRSSVVRLATAPTAAERRHWLRAVLGKRARIVLTSGGMAPVLDSGGGGHSVFARAVLEVLGGNAELLDGQRLFREVAARVSFAADNVGFDQVPEYAPIRYAGHEAGEFFFVPRP